MTIAHQVKLPCVVVIQDDAAFRDILREILTGEGYEVLGASTWQGGSRLARDVQPDLVITDWFIGFQDAGMSLLWSLRLDPVTETVPVLICPGFISTLREHLPFIERLQATACPDPFDLKTFVNQVQSLAHRVRKTDGRDGCSADGEPLERSPRLAVRR